MLHRCGRKSTSNTSHTDERKKLYARRGSKVSRTEKIPKLPFRSYVEDGKIGLPKVRDGIVNFMDGSKESEDRKTENP